MSSLVLGIDGGGTQTRALLLASDGTVLGQGKAGVSNANTVGVQGAATQILAAISEAWSSAQLKPQALSAVFMGLAGVGAAGIQPTLRQALLAKAPFLPVDFKMTRDAEAALAGGIPGRSGLVLIAGTGSFCLGRDSSQRVATCGGWGWLLDDIGSGFYLGREALRAVLFAADGRGPATVLSSLVKAELGVSTSSELVGWVYSRNPYTQPIAALAKRVLEAAASGDAVANAILEAGARGLAELAQKTISQLTWNGAPELVLAGGVALSGAPYQPVIEAALRATVPSLKLTAPELPPVAGAALRALELLDPSLVPAALPKLREAQLK